MKNTDYFRNDEYQTKLAQFQTSASLYYLSFVKYLPNAAYGYRFIARWVVSWTFSSTDTCTLHNTHTYPFQFLIPVAEHAPTQIASLEKIPLRLLTSTVVRVRMSKKVVFELAASQFCRPMSCPLGRRAG